jgi:hypothetical protein
MNSIKASSYLNELPFLAWQCITVQLYNREVDLVIPNQADMDDFLMILVDSLRTVDGNRGSQNLVEQVILKQKQDMKNDGQDVRVILTPKDKNSIFQSTLTKFKILRIRSKISLMAFLKNKSINEMILEQILATYDILLDSKLIKMDPVS